VTVAHFKEILREAYSHVSLHPINE